MKKNLTLLALLFISILTTAQNNVNLIIFSEDIEPFYAYINGVKQNDKAETNVRIAGISPNIALRIEFENKALPVIKQNMSLLPGFEHTARLKKDKNQVMKLKYFGQVPIEQAVTDKAVATVNYHTAESPNETSTNVNDNSGSVNTSVSAPGGHSHVSISSTTTTTKTSNNNSENAQMNVTMPGININMNVADPNINADVQTTTSTTVTSSNSSGANTTYASNHDRHNTPNHPAPVTKPVTPPAPQPVAQPVKVGCSVPMSDASFSKMKQAVDSKPFSDTKMSTAKVATKSNCLSVSQVMEIAKLFSMDDDKLTYAKYAYDYCTDKGNYYLVSEVFSFSTTTEDFNKFLEK